MKTICRSYFWIVVMLAVLGCSGLLISRIDSHPDSQQEPSSPIATRVYIPPPTEDFSDNPSPSNLKDGWSEISPGGITSCARGGTYSFFVRKTDSEKLLIYFEGGGSCYDGETCRDGGNYFDASIDPTDQADNPALKTYGLFDLANESNPFRDYNIVFVTYCTGDAYLGNQVVTYEYNNDTYEVNHYGYENTRMALDWTYQNFPEPDSVFAIGCSAGVIGSFFHAPHILEHYKGIPFTLIGDSGGGYLDGPASFAERMGTDKLAPEWLPQYKNLFAGGLIRSRYFFTIPPLVYPEGHFGLLDTQDDGVQAEIIARFDPQTTLTEVIQANLADIRSDAPDFLSYTSPGDYHCVTMSPNFYENEVDGTKLADWITALAAGQPVENIYP
jgi:hypothetical protein